MKSAKILSVFATLLLLASCSSKKTTHEVDNLESIPLSASKTFEMELLSVDKILMTDSIIWMYSKGRNDTILYAYEVNGKLLSKGLSKGQGKNELLQFSSMHPGLHGGVEIYDNLSGKIYSVESEADNFTLIQCCDSLLLMNDAMMISDDIVLLLPIDSNNSYITIDKNKIPIDSLAYYPPKPDGVDDRTHHLACTGSMEYSRTDNRFIRTLAYGGGIQFFSVTDGKLKHIGRHVISEMSYGVTNAGIEVPTLSADTPCEYRFAYATPTYFYATYSDKNGLDNLEGTANEVHVFDHEGNLIRKLILDKDVARFAVAADDSKLYASHDNGECMSILVYDLP